MNRIFSDLPNPDANFVKDFQTQGFDARIWELFLFALREDGFWDVRRPRDTPDYLFVRGTQEAWIEAVTAGSSQKLHEPGDPERFQEFIDNGLAMRFGTPLGNKLAKRYWELPYVAGKPVVIAIADFVERGVVRWGEQGLRRYLYGLDAVLTSEPGQVVDGMITTVARHAYVSKSIPSGFFNFPEAENISAVLFDNSGTVAKFHRKAFDPTIDRSYRLLRHGFCPDPRPESPLPQPFAYVVGEVAEAWSEGTIILHNPNAVHPLDESFFKGTMQWWLKNGAFEVEAPEFQPFNSVTTIFPSENDVDEEFERSLDDLAERIVTRNQMSDEDLAKTYERHRGMQRRS